MSLKNLGSLYVLITHRVDWERVAAALEHEMNISYFLGCTVLLLTWNFSRKFHRALLATNWDYFDATDPYHF